MFYLKTQSTQFIYGYKALDIWLRITQIVREETRCRHMGYSFRIAARVLLCASSHRHDITYYGLCYTSRGALAGERKKPIKSNGARWCSVVRAVAHFAMGRRIDPSWWNHGAIFRSSLCSTTGVTKAVVRAILTSIYRLIKMC